MQRALAVAIAALAGVLVVPACSGRVITQQGGTGGAAGAAGSAGETGSCVTPSGVRLCGAGCGWLDAPDCPGLGCARGEDIMTGKAVDAGVCLPDIGGDITGQCWDCPDGDACFDQNGVGLVCVPLEVCRELWLLGVKNVCRYADKSAYDGRPLADPGSKCPDPNEMCGGHCGCAFPGLRSCTGRSADRRLGICVSTDLGYVRCQVSPGKSNDCPALGGRTVCGVFENAGDQSAALAYGACLYPDSCRYLRAHLPGGFLCYDRNGKLLP